jgi:hypothetical protein
VGTEHPPVAAFIKLWEDGEDHIGETCDFTACDNGEKDEYRVARTRADQTTAVSPTLEDPMRN